MESPVGFIEGFQMKVVAESRKEEAGEELERRKKDALLDWTLSPVLV